jgi:type IV pilus assembly protein PilO
MRKIDLQNQSLVVGSFVGLIILLTFYFIFLRPHINQLRQLNPQLLRLTRNVQNTAKDAANIDNLKKKLEDLKAKADFYAQKLPHEKEIPSLLENLSKVAKDSQVKIIEIQPQGKDIQSRKGMYLEVPVAIKARCGYHQLGRFINELERGPRFIRISDIEIKENPHDSRTHKVRLLLSMFVLLDHRP